MATKKKAKSGDVQHKKGTLMSPARIKEMQKLLAEIGTRKRDGFIYMATTDGKDKGNGKQEANGVLFIHQSKPSLMISNLIGKLGLDPTMVAMMLAMEGMAKD